MTLLTYLIYGTSTIASFSTYHQIYTIISTKSSDNISNINISWVFINMLSHFMYSVYIHNVPLILTFANSVLAVGIFLGTSIYYRRFSQSTFAPWQNL